jgi:hypothetical protein
MEADLRVTEDEDSLRGEEVHGENPIVVIESSSGEGTSL